MNAILFLIVLSIVLVAVAIFALQNAHAVTVTFLFWQLDSSVAVVTLVATAAGVLIAGLFRLASRLLRWKRGTPTSAAREAPNPHEGPPSAMNLGTDPRPYRTVVR